MYKSALKRTITAVTCATLVSVVGVGNAQADFIYDMAAPSVAKMANSLVGKQCTSFTKSIAKFNLDADKAGSLDYKVVVKALQNNKELKAKFDATIDKKVSKKGLSPSDVKPETRTALFNVAIDQIAAKGVECGVLTEKKKGEAAQQAKNSVQDNEKVSAKDDIFGALSSGSSGLLDGISS